MGAISLGVVALHFFFFRKVPVVDLGSSQEERALLLR